MVGTPHENPVTLTRQDWRGPQAGWSNNSLGHWDIEAAEAGQYDITVRFPAVPAESTVRLRLGKLDLTQTVSPAADRATFAALKMPAGTQQLEGSIKRGGQTRGVHYVDVLWRGREANTQ